MSDSRPRTASPHRDLEVLKGEPLAALDGVRHGFFTRRGGVSEGLYAGLNLGLGSNDDRAAVMENRERAMAVFGLTEPDLVTPWQVHSAEAVIVDSRFSGDRPRADGIVTKTPGIAIGVVTADCGPVLFADRRAGVVGAAHAGWRGALGGVLEATVAAMERCGSDRGDIVAVLGPTITRPNYEVGADMSETVLAADTEAGGFFTKGARPGKRQFDLPGFIVARLRRAGVSASFVGRCTYAQEDLFFSFRRATHRGEADYGRQLAAIAIEG